MRASPLHRAAQQQKFAMSSSPSTHKATTPDDSITQAVTQPTTPAQDVPIRNDVAMGVAQVASSVMLDWTVILGMVFGGCCSNAWSLEKLLLENPRVGPALTFCQLLFVASRALPSFLAFGKLPGTHLRILPGLKTRVVPLRRWLIDVLLFVAVSYLNNWVFSFRIPLAVQIVFRSGGLSVSMILGYLYLKKRYTVFQVMAVILVTVGVITATLSKPKAPRFGTSMTVADVDAADYAMGVVMLAVGLILSGFLGLRQETTYKIYGPQWKEGLFYTHLLSLPFFGLRMGDVVQGLQTVGASEMAAASVSPLGSKIRIPALYWVLLLNVLSQYLCVAGVNRLTSRVSSVGVNLILTARKALSVLISVLWFGGGWNLGLGAGAAMVVAGTILYACVPSAPTPDPGKDKLKTS